ncbi:unnamed protein product [Calicophoron daubneyi]|uniref:F-box domain-containing protein n=1 Tax=Calicophoron daubneyi TaxID=300641 RepID=A0AAV2T8L7_CALDB
MDEWTATLIFRAWRKTVAEARKAREYFAQLQQETQSLDELHAVEQQPITFSNTYNLRENYQNRVAELPEVTQLRIFSYLSPLDVARAAKVCRAWMSTAEKMNTIGRLDLSRLGGQLTDKMFVKITRKRRIRLHQINLHGCTNLGPLGFRALSSYANLQDINLSECVQLTDDYVLPIASGCPALLYLNLSYTPITDNSIRHLTASPTMLQFLSLAHCYHLTKDGSRYFGQGNGFPKLTYLDLSGCVQLGPEGLIQIVEAVCTVRHWILNEIPWLSDNELKILGSSCNVIETLEILESGIMTISTVSPAFVSLNDIERTSALAFATTKSKKSVEMGSSAHFKDLRSQEHLITDGGLQEICRRGLKSLLASRLNGLDGSCFRDALLVNEEARSALANKHKKNSSQPQSTKAKQFELSYLTQLCLKDCTLVSDSLFRHLASVPCLTVLNLSGCTGLTDAGIKLLVESCYASFLRELYLAGCRQLTDRSVFMIDHKFPQLAYLSLADCDLLSDSALDVLSQCKSLWQLNLSNTQLGDRSIATFGSLPKLRELKVSSCVNITDTGVQKYAHSGIYAQCVDLSFCYNLSDSGIKTLAFCCRFLMHLNLAGCAKLTDMSLQYISGVCQYLQKLNMSGCVQITEIGLTYLRRGCKQLNHLILLYCKGLNKREVIRLTTKVSCVEFSSDNPPTEFQAPDQSTA